MKARVLNGLALALVVATGLLGILYAVIAVEPTAPLNPFPPPTMTATPVHWPEPEAPKETATLSPTPSPFPTPTLLRPSPLTPTPEPAYPFTATVEVSPGATDCRAEMDGAVIDRQGRGLEGYPVHLWAAEAMFSLYETVLFSDEAGRWQASLPAGARGVWYVQLHAPDARKVYPPLSPVVAVALPDTCSWVTVEFRER